MLDLPLSGARDTHALLSHPDSTVAVRTVPALKGPVASLAAKKKEFFCPHTLHVSRRETLSVRPFSLLPSSPNIQQDWNFTRVGALRPGPPGLRVDATKDPTNNVYVSARRSDTDVVIVVVNRNTSSQSLTFSIPSTSVASYEKFTTSSSKSMSDDGTVEASNGSLPTTFHAQSVTTLHSRVDTGDPPSAGCRWHGWGSNGWCARYGWGPATAPGQTTTPRPGACGRSARADVAARRRKPDQRGSAES